MNLPADKKSQSKLRPILATLGIILAGAGGLTSDYYVHRSINLGYDLITENEYDQLRPEIVARMRTSMDTKTPLTRHEVVLWTAICNEELRRDGGVTLRNVTDKTLTNKLLVWMEGR